MGCDLNWIGKEPDIIKQKQCSMFLHIVFDKAKLDYTIYNEMISGIFLEKKHGSDVKIRTSLELLGITAHYGKYSSLVDEEWIAERQISFVFNNSLIADDFNRIITFEEIHNLSNAKYDGYRPHFQSLPEYKKERIGIFQNDSYLRILSNQVSSILTLYYLVNILFLPELKVYDDFLVYDGIHKQLGSDGFSEALRIPSKRWKAIEAITEKYMFISIQQSDVTEYYKNIWEVSLFD